MLDIPSKGHLGVGADADITVLDLAAGRAVLSIAAGEVIMVDGVAVGRGARFLTTPDGATYLRDRWEDVSVLEA
jgi:formylmethanofuran dehydrogenase subunit A